MAITLRISKDGVDKGTTGFGDDEDLICIGRDASNHIILGDETFRVSRQHAVIVRAPGKGKQDAVRYFVRDLSADDGTLHGSTITPTNHQSPSSSTVGSDMGTQTGVGTSEQSVTQAWLGASDWLRIGPYRLDIVSIDSAPADPIRPGLDEIPMDDLTTRDPLPRELATLCGSDASRYELAWEVGRLADQIPTMQTLFDWLAPAAAVVLGALNSRVALFAERDRDGTQIASFHGMGSVSVPMGSIARARCEHGARARTRSASGLKLVVPVRAVGSRASALGAWAMERKGVGAIPFVDADLRYLEELATFAIVQQYKNLGPIEYAVAWPFAMTTLRRDDKGQRRDIPTDGALAEHTVITYGDVKDLPIGENGWRRHVITRSPQMEQLLRNAKDAANSDASVFIGGATGTGKELIARAIHLASPRRLGPFVAVNCAAFPKELLESELFGYKRGAFTGANADRLGLIRTADNGTLFLDEIGDMPQELQQKLLRVLQERQVQPLGDTKSVSVDVRIISATDLDLEAPDLGFRQALYFRIATIKLQVPPLCDRREDIPLLVHYYLDYFAARRKAAPVRVSSAAMELLMKHSWPGNVRDLRNVMERAIVKDRPVLLSSDIVLDSNAPESIAQKPAALAQGPDDASNWSAESPVPGVEGLKRQALIDALKKHGGNYARAANELGISANSVRNWMDEFDIPRPKRQGPRKPKRGKGAAGGDTKA